MKINKKSWHYWIAELGGYLPAYYNRNLYEYLGCFFNGLWRLFLMAVVLCSLILSLSLPAYWVYDMIRLGNTYAPDNSTRLFAFFWGAVIILVSLVASYVWIEKTLVNKKLEFYD